MVVDLPSSEKYDEHIVEVFVNSAYFLVQEFINLKNKRSGNSDFILVYF
jgi:hypothetical protein